VSPRLHPEYLPTVGVLVVVTFVVGALLTPPDPFTQLLYAGPGVVLSGLVAAILTYGDGFERLGLSPTGRDHGWTAAGFLVGSGLAGLLVPDPTALAGNVVALLVGLVAGAWLGWAGGRERLSLRSRNP
jgi:hypothetical protein